MGTRSGNYAAQETGHAVIVGSSFGTVTGADGGVPPDGNTYAGLLSVYALGFVGAGGTVTFQAYYASGQSNAGARVASATIVTIRFVPEASYPQ